MSLVYAPPVAPVGGLPAGTRVNFWPITVGSLTLGMVDVFGVEWDITEVEGWDGPPGAVGLEQRPTTHGGRISDPYKAQARAIVIRGAAEAPSAREREAAEARLYAAVTGGGALMVYHREAAQQMQVYPNGQPTTPLVNPRAFEFELPLVAPDPRKYHTNLLTRSTGLPSVSGGLVVSTPGLVVSSPGLVVHGVQTSGVLTLVNDGTMETPGTFAVRGPCPPFTLTHLGTRERVRYHRPLSAGRLLYLTSGPPQRVLEGTDGSTSYATRSVQGTVFDLEPGENRVLFEADSFDERAEVTAQYRSADR